MELKNGTECITAVRANSLLNKDSNNINHCEYPQGL